MSKQASCASHAPVPRHAALRPAWRLSGGPARCNTAAVAGTGCTPIFGLFVQDCACWTRWYQHDPRLIPVAGFAPPGDSQAWRVEV